MLYNGIARYEASWCGKQIFKRTERTTKHPQYFQLACVI